MWEAVLARLKEPSTYAGIAFLLGIIGVNITPEAWGGVLTVAGVVGGVLSIVIPEGKK